LKKAKRPYTGKGKQQKWEFCCSECKGWFKQKDVSIDHIIPAGSLNSFEDLAGFASRLFVGQEGLQLLCSECHNKKTQEERNK
jgi:5-methylcytosine-specific restriction endonuclease McrA